MLILYDLKLMPFPDLGYKAWLVIIGGALSFILGTITIFVARDIFNLNNGINEPKKTTLDLFKDDGRALKYAIYFTGIIGLFGAIQNWIVLINKFGSIPGVFLSASKIYNMRVDEGIAGVIPYLSGFFIASLCLAGAYTAYKNKITLAAVVPFIAAILKSLAQFGRIGILIAFVTFFAAFFIYRYLIIFRSELKIQSKKVIIIFIVFFILVIGSASAVKFFRGTYEAYQGTSSELANLKSNIIISPSIYLYLSSHVGVLSRYLDKDIEEARFGENTLAPFYNLFSKFEWTERVPYDVKGYLIPMWTNSGTYLRELHADYGTTGVFLVPFLIGLITTFFWVKFYNTGNFSSFAVLVFLYIIIVISFFSLVTRGADWFIALFLLLSSIPFIEKLSNYFAINK